MGRQKKQNKKIEKNAILKNFQLFKVRIRNKSYANDTCRLNDNATYIKLKVPHKGNISK